MLKTLTKNIGKQTKVVPVVIDTIIIHLSPGSNRSDAEYEDSDIEDNSSWLSDENINLELAQPI